jgi:hypothetical protein
MSQPSCRSQSGNTACDHKDSRRDCIVPQFGRD